MTDPSIWREHGGASPPEGIALVAPPGADHALLRAASAFGSGPDA